MAKAALLGDNGGDEGEDLFAMRNRGGRVSLGGAVGRAPRLAPRAATGVASVSLGGPRPVTPVFGGGGRPVERQPEDVR